MNKKTNILLISLLSLILLVGGCGSAGRDLMSDIRPAANIAQDLNRSPELIKPLNSFSLALTQRAAVATPSGNFLLSPLSAYFALGMVRNGAGGTTADEMSNVLGMADLALDDVNDGIHAWLVSLADADGKAKLSVANSIWHDEGFAANKAFLQTNADHFLSDVRMPSAFDPQAADFTGLGSSPNGNVFISAVRHKTYCRVDEKGTEASAATAVEMSGTSMPAKQKELVFDRPFLYGIIDVKTGVPLFLGLMEDPR